MILYDAIGTLADSVGNALNKPEYINLILPPLIQKWNQIADDDRNFLPLLECLTSVSAALELGFQSFAHPIYARCLKLIENTLLEQQVFLQHLVDLPLQRGSETLDKDFMIAALDLISGLTEGLKSSIESLVGGSNLMHLLYECLKVLHFLWL